MLGSVKEENPHINFENFAKDAYVKYDITFRDADDPIRNTLGPGEVYSLYLYAILKDSGMITVPYNIAGREDFFSQSSIMKDFDNFATGVLGSVYTKTIVFVSLGVLLLVISFLYNKYKNIIADDSEN